MYAKCYFILCGRWQLPNKLNRSNGKVEFGVFLKTEQLSQSTLSKVSLLWSIIQFLLATRALNKNVPVQDSVLLTSHSITLALEEPKELPAHRFHAIQESTV